jgi:hypothetical protein
MTGGSKKLVEWLNEENYKYCNNFILGGKFPDLIAVRKNEIIAFEFKKHAKEITMALGQCLFYLNDANKACIILPESEEKLISEGVIRTLRTSGIGLMTVGEKIRTIVEPKQFQRDNLSALNRLKRRIVPIKNGIVKEETFIKKRIVETLKDHPEGLSFLDLSRHTDISRFTIAKYVMVLGAEGLVSQRNIGTSKLCFAKGGKNARK